MKFFKKSHWHITFIIFIFSSIFLTSCKEKMTEDEIAGIGISECRIPANYIKKLGFDVTRTAYSTEAQQFKGIVLVQGTTNPTDTNIRFWQHPSWTVCGYMGSVTTDDKGFAYCAPIPFVNTLNRTLDTLNQIYRIDNETGEMKNYIFLPKIDSVEGMVPFCILGLFYDCHGQKLYASSVGGSTRDEEKGVIYVIDTKTKKIVDQLKGVDACGVFVNGLTGTKKLFYGKARTSEIFSVELDKEGLIEGKPQLELSLEGLGPRGSDIARRIRADKFGNLNIYGIDFSFSLAAQSKKPESYYQFGYNREEKKWIFLTVK